MVRVVRCEYDDGTLAGLELWVFKADGSHTETPLWNKDWEGALLPAPSTPTAPMLAVQERRTAKARAIAAASSQIRRNGTG